MRLYSVDTLRAAAALAICLYHLSHGFAPAGSWSEVAFFYGYLGVQVFFVVTGLVVPFSFIQKKYTYAALGATVRHRAWRIEPAYWVSIFLMLLMDVVARLVPGQAASVPPFEWGPFLLNFVHLNALFGLPWLRDAFWYLAIDWQFFLLAVLAAPLLLHQSRWVRYSLLLALGALAWLPISYAFLPRHLLPYLTGVVLCWHVAGWQRWPETLALLALVLTGIYWHSGVTHLVAVGLSAAVVLGWKWEVAAISWLSKNSYALYLTHLFAGWAVANGLKMLWPQWPGLAVLLGTAAALVFAAWFQRHVEARLVWKGAKRR